MADQELFPGQKREAVFDIEQVKALASPPRSEVFWSFSNKVPLSVAEVARSIGKTAQSVHYHAGELEAAGLLLPVGTRKRRSRTEILYVHTARGFKSQGKHGSPEYRQYSHKAFVAMVRDMARENATLHRAVDVDPDFADYFSFSRRTLLLTFEDALKIRARLSEIAAELTDSPANEPRLRFNVITYISPKADASKEIVRRKPKKPKA